MAILINLLFMRLLEIFDLFSFFCERVNCLFQRMIWVDGFLSKISFGDGTGVMIFEPLLNERSFIGVSVFCNYWVFHNFSRYRTDEVMLIILVKPVDDFTKLCENFG